MIPVQVNNNTYKSISEAWRETSPAGLPQITVRWRLNQGWDADIAFQLPTVPPAIRCKFKGVRVPTGNENVQFN